MYSNSTELCAKSFIGLLFIILVLIKQAEGRCPPKQLLGPCRCSTTENSITCYSQLTVNLKAIFTDISAFMRPSDLQMRTFRLSGLPDHRTGLDELEENVFNGFQFENIHISYTTLERIHANAFASTFNYTKRLVLTSNRLKNSRYNQSKYELFDILSKFPKITHIDVSGNELQVIPSQAFRPLHGVQEHLNSMKFASNFIMQVEDEAFANLPNIVYIGLNSNDIDRLSEKSLSFLPSDTVCDVNLFDNYLSENSFQGKTLANLLRPIRLVLDHNRIRELNEDTFKPFLAREGTELSVNHNPMTCGCGSVWLLRAPNSVRDKCRNFG
ncbi:Immunoglobulin superfamily containing leucine-rich repeat protein [Halotydeus destructor]|nr:Immunoglobulin superfamily containing leucine-rich repeat protein [Halotydeus destructor]